MPRESLGGIPRSVGDLIEITAAAAHCTTRPSDRVPIRDGSDDVQHGSSSGVSARLALDVSIASRNGKLHIADGDDGTRWRTREDLLTADVFGAYRYLPVDLGVGPVLAGAVDEGGRTLADWARARTVAWPALTEAWFAFWPNLDGREPDLVVVLGESRQLATIAVLIEVKLHADQHEIDGRSQLGHYGLSFLQHRFEDQRIDVPLPSLRPIVYITKSREPDLTALRRARSELALGGREAATDVFWTSWTAAVEAGEKARDRIAANAPRHQLAVIEDLLADLAERGFHRRRRLAEFPLIIPRDLGDFIEPEWERRSRSDDRRLRALADLGSAWLPRADHPLANWRLT